MIDQSSKIKQMPLIFNLPPAPIKICHLWLKLASRCLINSRFKLINLLVEAGIPVLDQFICKYIF